MKKPSLKEVLEEIKSELIKRKILQTKTYELLHLDTVIEIHVITLFNKVIEASSNIKTKERQPDKKYKLNLLENQLRQALEKEDFLEAARLRDLIKNLN